MLRLDKLSEGKCCDSTNIGREVLRLDILSKGKCCSIWTIIGRKLLRLTDIGREVLRLDNYRKGSVAIGELY